MNQLEYYEYLTYMNGISIKAGASPTKWAELFLESYEKNKTILDEEHLFMWFSRAMTEAHNSEKGYILDKIRELLSI